MSRLWLRGGGHRGIRNFKHQGWNVRVWCGLSLAAKAALLSRFKCAEDSGAPPPHGRRGQCRRVLLDPRGPGCWQWLGPPEAALLPPLRWVGLRPRLPPALGSGLQGRMRPRSRSKAPLGRCFAVCGLFTLHWEGGLGGWPSEEMMERGVGVTRLPGVLS